MENNEASYNGYCEYLTPVKATGKIKAHRALITVLAVALSALALILTFPTVPVVGFLLVLVIAFFARLAWQYTKIEYEYTIATGELELSKIYGARSRRVILSIGMSDVAEIFPLSRLGNRSENILFACGRDDGDAYCLKYDGGILVISAPERTKACLKHYKRSAFFE